MTDISNAPSSEGSNASNGDEDLDASKAQAPAPVERKDSSIAVLLIAIAAIAAVGVATGTAKVLLMIVALIAVIMIHELGHFATAKWSGMKVTEYFVGFGPRLWSIRRGETEYGFKAIPAGGYVKIIGMSNLEEVDPADEPRTYRQQPYWQRLLVATAGIITHFVLGILILFALNAWIGLPAPTTTVGSVSRLGDQPSPAEVAGFEVGDKVLSVNGAPVSDWDQIPSYIQNRVGEPVVFNVQRAEQRVDLTAVPVDRKTVVGPSGQPLGSPSDAPAGFIGVGPAFADQTAAPWDAMKRSVDQLFSTSYQVAKVLVETLSPMGLYELGERAVNAGGEEPAAPAPATGTTEGTASAPDEDRLMSVVGLVNIAGDAADAGVRPVLALLFVLNISLAVFNLIPLLPFDGGHIAVATYERIRSRKGHRHMVDFAKLMPLSYAVILALVFLGVSTIWLDIVEPVESPF